MDEGNWRSTLDDVPGWKDSGRAQLRYADGRVVDGRLMIDVNSHDDNPVAVFTADTGEWLSLFNAEEWRLTPTGSAAPPRA